MTSDPVWLPREVILATHEILLNRFGGLAGIRDEGLLDSAIGRPLQLLAYGDPSLFDLAAAYSFGIVRNHPFLDGNKRIGFMSAYIFLSANGQELNAPEEEAVTQTLALAAGVLEESDFAKWLERSCKKND